jgi:very-short-patch-repair endonuclease
MNDENDDTVDTADAHARDGMIAGRQVRRVKQERARAFRRYMTPEEARLWQHLRANQMDGLRWRRQQVIGGFIADFYCHAAGVVVEIDGDIHLHQADYDRARDEVLARSGLRVLRFSNDDVITRLDQVLARIRSTCQRDIR